MTTILLLLAAALAQEPLAVPVAADAPAEPAAAPAEPAAAPAEPPAAAAIDRGPGRVTELDAGRPVIDRGTRDGLKVGDIVELYTEDVRRIGSGEISELKPITKGKVVAVTVDAAIVAIGVNVTVPVGARAQEVLHDDGRAFLAPPRLGGRGYFRAEARGLVSTTDYGGGVYASGTIGYRFKFPMTVELRATPLFVGVDNNVAQGKGSVMGLVMFDHHVFAVGLGGGVAINPEGVLPIFAQRLRVGAEDGLAFTFTSQITQEGSRNGQAQWGVDQNEAIMQIPLTNRGTPAWLLLRGQGGDHVGGGEVGARFRLHGNGEPGTWGLTPLVGGEVYTAGGRSLVGPTFGLGVEAGF